MIGIGDFLTLAMMLLIGLYLYVQMEQLAC